MRLTKPQSKIYQDDTRFRVIVAGRRFGKTFLSTVELITKAIEGQDKNVWYVAPTYKAAKEIAWDMLLTSLPREYIRKTNESSLTVTLINGSTISLKGAEKADNLRGRALDFVVMDEFADMKPETWYAVLRPSLSDRKGSAIFIGTPKGRNHLYDLWTFGTDKREDWSSYQFTTIQGEQVDADEIEKAKQDLDHLTRNQSTHPIELSTINQVVKVESLTLERS